LTIRQRALSNVDTGCIESRYPEEELMTRAQPVRSIVAMVAAVSLTIAVFQQTATVPADRAATAALSRTA
jgi:hypothetical protein